MIDIACVCVGDRYTPDLYVGQLYQAVKRNVTLPYTFNVLTDDPTNTFYKTIECRIIPVQKLSTNKLWWHKIELFNRQNFSRTVFYLDLDTVIIGNVDKFLNYEIEKFCICQDFNRKWIKDYHVSNSSIMRWHAPNYYDLYENFIANSEKIMRKFHGDQDYITNFFKDRTDLKWWPDTWAMSFKWEIFRGGLIKSGTGLDEHQRWPARENFYHNPEQKWILPGDCSIVVFHGIPDPYDTEFGLQHKI